MKSKDNNISIKSIYNLVINLQKNKKKFNLIEKDINHLKENTNRRFDVIEKDNKEISQRLSILEKDNIEIKKNINQLKSLPTIKKELNITNHKV